MLRMTDKLKIVKLINFRFLNIKNKFKNMLSRRNKDKKMKIMKRRINKSRPKNKSIYFNKNQIK